MPNASFSLLQGDPTTWGVPAVGKTFLGINQSGQLVLKQNDGSIVPLISSSPSIGNQSNTSGATTVTIGAQVHTASVDVLGTGRAVPIVLSLAGVTSGAQLTLLITMPAVSGLALDIRNGSAGGIQLDTFTSDGSIVSAVWHFSFDGSAWKKIEVQIPAY